MRYAQALIVDYIHKRFILIFSLVSQEAKKMETFLVL